MAAFTFKQSYLRSASSWDKNINKEGDASFPLALVYLAPPVVMQLRRPTWYGKYRVTANSSGDLSQRNNDDFNSKIDKSNQKKVLKKYYPLKDHIY